MITSLIGQKKEQGQRFLENGARIPVTRVDVSSNVVVGLKTPDRDNYTAVILGFGMKKKPGRALAGATKKAALDAAPNFLREVAPQEADSLPKPGIKVKPSEIFKAGDVVDVTGISKGKGFAGGVKRHHFHGGPKTHGQSDRHRAPGSIGQGTTPGRVYKGKRMAGRMGQDKVTVKNLKIVQIDDAALLIQGLIPGGWDSLIEIKKVGEAKKFVGLYSEVETEKTADQVSEVKTQEEIQTLDAVEKPATTEPPAVAASFAEVATKAEEAKAGKQKLAPTENTEKSTETQNIRQKEEAKDAG